MALESAIAAETLIQSNADSDDLEDGEIPSDEDDEPVAPIVVEKSSIESSKTSSSTASSKSESSKGKSSDTKSSKSKKSSSTTNSNSGSGSSKSDRFGKYKNPSDDWAGDVEKAIRAVLEEDRSKNQDSKSSKSKSSSRSRSRKKPRDEKDDDRPKDQKRRRLSEDENGNEDDDEMLFVRGASPVRREVHDDSPLMSRRSNERDNFDHNSDRDSEERSSRHRDSEKRSSGSGRGLTNRRGVKADRGCKNKNRGQIRNERNGRRNQNNDHNQDPDAICVYYMQGKCHRGDDCPFSHNAMPPRKMELCKFYLMDCCAKRDKCLYMHHDFPCKFFHTGLKCTNGENCKFSHEPLNEQVKNILLKHLETAPKEILGDFPRLSREGALMMINNTARNLAEGHDTTTQKIPSLFDVTLTAPTTNSPSEKEDDTHVTLNNMEGSQTNHPKRSSSLSSKDRKPAGKKTRWGSDEDRVPLEQIMLLQSVSQLGLHLPNVALSFAVQQQLQQRILLQQCIANMEFYNEIQGSPTGENDSIKSKDKDSITTDIDSIEMRAQQINQSSIAQTKDIDLRQLLTNGPNPLSVMSIADEAATLSQSKFDDESDHDGESDLVIAVPADEDDKNKDKTNDEREKGETKIGAHDDYVNEESSVPQDNNSDGTLSNDNENPPNLPKKAQELFLRIQQQQRAANDSMINNDEKNTVGTDAMKTQEDWYSDEDDDGDNDDDDDDDDEDHGNLQIVLKDNSKDENEKSDHESPMKESQVVEHDPNIPQPAMIVDKLGDLSKIDISAEVTKLLSSIKPHQGSSSKKDSKVDSSSKDDSSINKGNESSFDNGINIDKASNSLSNSENGCSSPRASTNSGSISRDPRMSRDPRQRRTDETKSSSPNQSDMKKENQSLRQETSIYSSGITIMDAGVDTDLRTHVDQDHRRQDMDFRQRFQQDFGDTDLRVTSGFSEGSTRTDVDLRQMLSLPFKPAPSHVPCTEIDASIASHSQVTYKVYVVDIPRPNYTGLKLTKNDALVKYDPRLRKIFRLSQTDIADSPMSPPPMKPDTPKSPPQIRADPRRKTMEAAIHPSQTVGPSGLMSTNVGSQQSSQDLPLGIGGPGMQISSGMAIPLGQNQMMGNMTALGPMGSIMNGPMQPPNVAPMGMGTMGNIPPGMGPNGPPMGPNQLAYEQQRYNAQRNGGPGLLGPAPRLGFPDPRDVGPNYDGPPYSSNSYGNFGPGPGPGPNDTMMGYGPNGPSNMNFGGNGPDWPSASQNPMRRGGRVRRRNRNRANTGGRSNRSPP